jgi:hypothetical protein
MTKEPETDVQRLIKELAATGADPAWVAEAVAIEQEEQGARRRPQLRLVSSSIPPADATRAGVEPLGARR